MKVKLESFDLKLPKDGKRSDGLHLSQVIRDYALLTKVLDAKYDTDIEEENPIMVHQGLAWENYLAAYQHPEIYFHPGELVKNGIAMSPDGFSISTVSADWILNEFKYTLKSSRDFKQKLLMKSKSVKMYLWQIMSYRHAMNEMLKRQGMEPNGICKLHMMFARGNYSKNFDDPGNLPTYQIFRIEFTQDELRDNWRLMLNHARSMGHDE
jgi:hypothetical protein